jgi:glycerol-3-phosphate acyltransferase PlsY
VSLGSLIGSLAGGVLLLLLVVAGWNHAVWLVYGIAAVCIVWIAHADNIRRLLSGEERKFVFGDREAT